MYTPLIDEVRDKITKYTDVAETVVDGVAT